MPEPLNRIRCVNRINDRWCHGIFTEVRKHVEQCSHCGETRFMQGTPLNYRDISIGIYQPLGAFQRVESNNA